MIRFRDKGVEKHQQLVASARNRFAFIQQYGQYCQKNKGHTCRNAHHKDVEVVTEALVDILQTWLVQVTARKCINHIEKRGAPPQKAGDSLAITLGRFKEASEAPKGR